MLDLVNRTLEKFRAMIDEEFAGLDIYTADEKTPHARGSDLRAFRAADKKDTRRRQAQKRIIEHTKQTDGARYRYGCRVPYFI